MSVTPFQGNSRNSRKGSPYLVRHTEAIKSVAAGLRFIFVPVIVDQHWLLMTIDLPNKKVYHHNSMKIKQAHRNALSKCLTTVKHVVEPVFPDRSRWGKPIEAEDFPQQEG